MHWEFREVAMRRGSDASRECIDIMDPLLTVYVKRTTCMQVIRKGSLGETGLVHTALFMASTIRGRNRRPLFGRFINLQLQRPVYYSGFDPGDVKQISHRPREAENKWPDDTHLVRSSTTQVAPYPCTCSRVCEVQTAKTLAPEATPDRIPLGASSKTMHFLMSFEIFSAPVR
jgi:hypothetical protein